MQTIKIFLASSCELADERKFIGDNIRQLSDSWRIRNVRFSLLIWEDFHPEYRGVRMQTEYDEKLVRPAHIVLGLFRDKCGMYTQEEIKIAKGCNMTNLHIFRLPQVTTNNEVDAFLTCERLSANLCADVNDVWTKVETLLIQYAHTHIDIEERATGSQLPCSNLYATYFPDLLSIKVEVGEIIRSLSEILVEQHISDIQLAPFGHIAEISNAEHYLAFMKDQTDAASESEFSFAFTQNKANGLPYISPYITVGGYIKRNSKVVDSLLKTTGAFTVDLPNLETLKLQLLLYYFKRLNYRNVDLQYSPIQYRTGCLFYQDRGLASVNSVVSNTEIKKQVDEYEKVCQELDVLTSQENLDNKKVQLQKLKNSLSKSVLLSLSNLLTEIMRKGVRADLSIDYSKPYDFNLAKRTIDSCLDRRARAEAEVKDAEKELKVVFEELQARIDYLLANSTTESEKQELVDLVMRRRYLIESNLASLRDDRFLLLDSKLDELRMYQKLKISRIEGRTEDDISKETYLIADELEVISYDSEVARFNYANNLSRQMLLREALTLYIKCVENVNILHEATHQDALLLSSALAQCIHTSHALTEKDLTWKYFNRYSRFVRELKQGTEKVRLQIKADYYAAFLKIAPDTLTVGLYPFLNEAIELYLLTELNGTIDVTDEIYGLINCYLPNNIACFFIDRYEYSPHKWQYEQEGIRYADTMYENALKLRQYNPVEGMNFMAMARHNKGYMFDKVEKHDEAIIAYQEALSLRREIFTLMQNSTTKIEVAETLVNLAAAKSNWCKKHQKLTNHDPLPNAREAFQILKKYKDADSVGLKTQYYKGLQIFASVLYDFGSNSKKQRAIEMLKECWFWNVRHPENLYCSQFNGTAGLILEKEGIIKIIKQ